MDDLLDLDFAAKPSSQSAKPSAQSAYGNRTAFDYLAQQSAHRAPSPASGGVLQPSRTPTPNSRPPPAAASQSSGGDVFANLFGTSPAPAAQNGDKGLSMAERLQRESAAKIGGYGGLSGAAAGGGAFGGLSPVAGGGGSRAASPAFPPSRGASPASSLLSPTSASSRPISPSSPSSSFSSVPAKASSPWDFDLLNSSVPAASSAVKGAAGNDDPFDLGFDSLPSSSAAPPAKSATYGTAPADDFDLLDAFASPAPPVTSRPSPSPSPALTSARSPPPRSGSPPPHILGHLVEMGFSPSAARSALAATVNASTGDFDVERAVDVLMGGSGASAPRREERQEEPVIDERERRRREKQKRDEDEWGEEDNVKIGRRRSWEFEGGDDERKDRERIERRRRADAAAEQAQVSGSAPSASKPARSRGAAPSSSAPAEMDPNDPAAQLQQQATAALASAQKFGFSVMKSANSFFGQAREAALKAVEEQRAAARAKAGLPPTGGAADGGAQPGRPKWWKEGMDEEGAEGAAPPSGSSGKARAQEPPASSFKDSDDEGGDSVLQKRPPPRQQQQQQQAPPPTAAPAAEYRSPFRRAKAAPAAAAPPAALEADLLSGAPAPPAPSRSPAHAPSRSPAPSSARASPSPRPTPSNYRPRPSVSISPSALSSAVKHKAAGNGHFKLGRFGDASASYSAALEALPAGWIGRVLLLNNRAQSRLRSGEEKAAAEDCTEGLDVLLSIFTPPSLSSVDLSALSSDSAALPAPVLELAGAPTVDLKDQLGKALGRRAKAYEGVEKWTAAAADWEAVLKLGDETVVKGAGGRKMVNEGAARCRKMLGGPSPAPSSSAPRPATAAAASKPKPAAARPRPPPPPVEASGDAVRALQASRAAADAEDDARHALKDSVDAKILAWKGGKETNLRALIASLENVLWPELGWKKVGMHELVTDNGLKVRYVRAIAKVHPDKLNVNNTNVEQRMVAGLVFASLNEAWNASK
ncbi:hypothetical protein JCM6882_007230 [Rhodosporidiobolus microsporus]